MNLLRRSSAFFAGVIFLCSQAAAPAPAADKTALIVLVAANAKGAFADIIKAYEKTHKDVSINASYVGSKIIASELTSGAAADVVLMAQPTLAQALGTVDAPAVVFVNRTAIGVNKAATSKVHDAKDLMKAGVRIAAGTPGSTVAGFQDEAVAKMAVHYGKDFTAKYEANVVGKKTDTTKVGEMVSTGDADAAILYVADIDPAKMAMIKLGAEDEVSVPAVVATVKSSAHAAAAKDFAAFIDGTEASAIFRAHRHETK